MAAIAEGNQEWIVPLGWPLAEPVEIGLVRAWRVALVVSDNHAAAALGWVASPANQGAEAGGASVARTLHGRLLESFHPDAWLSHGRTRMTRRRGRHEADREGDQPAQQAQIRESAGGTQREEASRDVPRRSDDDSGDQHQPLQTFHASWSAIPEGHSGPCAPQSSGSLG
jgi:hypothetical protein